MVEQRAPMPGEARISGIVKIATRPISGATLTAVNPQGEKLATTTSEIDGSWALFLTPEVAFTLKASYPLTVPFSRLEQPLQERSMRRAGNITLFAGRLVTGTVLDAVGQPIPGAWAAVATQSSSPAALRDSIDEAGRLVLRDAPVSGVSEVVAPG